jgi:hypothetical protein
MMDVYEKDAEILHEYGPAFPTTIRNAEQVTTNFGMSLRDYFAAQAMPMFRGFDVTTYQSYGQHLISQAAQHAYAYADAMLAARNQTKEPQ